jgi:tetratricopeptide (TPR) repeat protein
MYVTSKTMTAYRAGRHAFSSGDFEQATTEFRWAAGLDPDNPIYSHAAAQSAARAGAYEQAEHLYLRALTVTSRTLGAKHPFMLIVACDLAAHRQQKGDGDPGLKQFGKQIVDLADLPAVARSGDRTLRALAELCGIADCLSTAVPFFEAALVSRREQFGEEHPKTRSCSDALAEIFSRLASVGAPSQVS